MDKKQAVERDSEQVSVYLEKRFIKHVAEVAHGQNRSLSSILGEACYRFFNWRPPQDADGKEGAR